MQLQDTVLLFFFGIATAIGMSANFPIEKSYQKTYYDNRALKAEGWKEGVFKTDYWHFYHPNGQVASKGNFKRNKKEGYWFYYQEEGLLEREGHYQGGLATDWWIFHDLATQSERRFQYKNNQKNGYALIYKRNRLKKAEKYRNDSKIGEWTSIFSFKRDNPNVSL